MGGRAGRAEVKIKKERKRREKGLLDRHKTVL